MIPHECICQYIHSYGGYSRMERNPECFQHGDTELLLKLYGMPVLVETLKFRINSLYGKAEMTYPTIIPQPPAVRGADYGRKAARRQENLKKYVSESGNVVVVTWAEIPDVVIDKQYALYVNGDAKAQLAGTSIVSLIELRDWLTDVIEAEVPVRLVESKDES